MKTKREFRRVAVGRQRAPRVLASLDGHSYYAKNVPFQHFSELGHFSVCRNTWSSEATMPKIVYVYEDGQNCLKEVVTRSKLLRRDTVVRNTIHANMCACTITVLHRFAEVFF